VRLAAAAAALRESVDGRLSPPGQAALDGRLRPARRALGERVAEAELAAGRALSLHEAIAEALNPPAEPAPESGAGSPSTVLSPREREVAALIARGLTNRQIAEGLVITKGTAANHVLHILDKLGVGSRAQVAAWAAEQGLLATDA
jgi:DNA-binding NarL/FixJ family response regulator